MGMDETAQLLISKRRETLPVAVVFGQSLAPSDKASSANVSW
jgi:hypothetical protein